MAIGVAKGDDRNSRTAWRNRSAPRRAVSSAPPSPSTRSSRAAIAALVSSLGVRRESRTNANSSRRRSTSSRNLANVTRRAASRSPSFAAVAQRRSNATRSSTRAQSPCTQLRTVPRATPWARATAATAPPRNHERTTTITSTIEAVLPGTASHGSTRSRCPHFAHRARRPSSTVSPRRRENQASVRWSFPAPHFAHRQAARIADVAVAISARYVVASQVGTWTNVPQATAGCRPRHRPRSLLL